MALLSSVSVAPPGSRSEDRGQGCYRGFGAEGRGGIFLGSHPEQKGRNGLSGGPALLTPKEVTRPGERLMGEDVAASGGLCAVASGEGRACAASGSPRRADRGVLERGWLSTTEPSVCLSAWTDPFVLTLPRVHPHPHSYRRPDIGRLGCKGGLGLLQPSDQGFYLWICVCFLLFFCQRNFKALFSFSKPGLQIISNR